VTTVAFLEIRPCKC